MRRIVRYRVGVREFGPKALLVLVVLRVQNSS